MKQINNVLQDLNKLKSVKKLDIKINTEKLYYLTQYATYYSDLGYYNTLKECLYNNFTAEELTQQETDQIMEAIEELSNDLMPYVDDSINEKVFKLLYNIKSIEQIENINNLYNNIIDNNIYNIPSIEDYMIYNNILNPEIWEEIADEDLRQHGTDASCLYWVKKIDYNYDFLELNAYENDFNGLDADDVIYNFLIDGDFNFEELLEV